MQNRLKRSKGARTDESRGGSSTRRAPQESPILMRTSQTLGRPHVRDMTIDDLARVFAIGNRVFTKDRHVFLYRTWETYEVTGLFSTDPELCIVAEIDDEVIGFCLGSTIEKPRSPWIYGYLVWTGVSPTLQGRKIGHLLYVEMERRMRRAGARMIIIDTEGTNQQAIDFFTRSGFSHGSTHLWMTKRIVRAMTGRRHQTRKKQNRGSTK